MPDEWDRVRELADRQNRGEGPGDDTTEKEQSLYKLIEQLRSSKQDLEQMLNAFRLPVGSYRVRLEGSAPKDVGQETDRDNLDPEESVFRESPE